MKESKYAASSQTKVEQISVYNGTMSGPVIPNIPNYMECRSEIFQRLDKVQTKMKAATDQLNEMDFDEVNYQKYQNNITNLSMEFILTLVTQMDQISDLFTVLTENNKKNQTNMEQKLKELTEQINEQTEKFNEQTQKFNE